MVASEKINTGIMTEFNQKSLNVNGTTRNIKANRGQFRSDPDGSGYGLIGAVSGLELSGFAIKHGQIFLNAFDDFFAKQTLRRNHRNISAMK